MRADAERVFKRYADVTEQANAVGVDTKGLIAASPEVSRFILAANNSEGWIAMTEATLIPASDQVQLMLDSPMTEGEQQQLAAIEARATSSAGKITINKIEMAQCLLEVYNDKLFRGKTGGRSWGDYLKSHFGKLGFQNALSTEAAVNHLNYAALCEAIDDWNDSNPSRQLPYPAGSTYLEGWTLLLIGQNTRW